MKHYIQLKSLSTGYIQGSVPPQFSKDNIKPIDSLGSDGIFYLDNRVSLSNMISKGIDICKSRGNTVGFDIVSFYSRYDGKVVYSKLF